MLVHRPIKPGAPTLHALAVHKAKQNAVMSPPVPFPVDRKDRFPMFLRWVGKQVLNRSLNATTASPKGLDIAIELEESHIVQLA